MKNTNYSKIYIYCKLLSISILFLFYNFAHKKKKVGVIGLQHSINIGNNLLKYAMFITLSNLGYDPYIIGLKIPHNNITFIKKETKLIIINSSFSELKKNFFDILMVNSDQTWRKFKKKKDLKHFYDIAFLKFAEKWKVPKFVYGASLGVNIWNFKKEDEKIAKMLLKDFTGISVRDKMAIKLIEKNLGFKPDFVLDPTLLIDKKYYLNLINNYKSDISRIDNYIFFYTVKRFGNVISFINKIKKENKYKIIEVKDNIKDFIYGIYYSKGVITDSFHGTVFSIIFKKPFIAFFNKKSKDIRFNSLEYIFGVKNRIYDIRSEPDITLLEKPLYLNMNIFNIMKKKSFQFLKTNLKKNKNFNV